MDNAKSESKRVSYTNTKSNPRGKPRTKATKSKVTKSGVTKSGVTKPKTQVEAETDSFSDISDDLLDIEQPIRDPSQGRDDYKTSIFIFHRALRIDDNTGLISALKSSKNVLPIFIFTPEQITNKNKFRSVPAIRFMIESLMDLDSHLRKLGSKLRIFYGEQHKVLDKILNSHKEDMEIESLYINMDYTPYAKQREEDLLSVCQAHNIDMYSPEDYLLQPVDSIRTQNGTYYSVYTPYYKNSVKRNVSKPIINRKRNFISGRKKVEHEVKIDTIPKKFGYNGKLSEIGLKDWPGTRAEGLKRVRDIKNHRQYKDNRNDLTLQTTRLSAYIKFGLVSPREVYHKIKDLFSKNHNLIGQLIWRDFYFNLVNNAPHVLKGKSFREKYDKIKWRTNKKLLEKWKTGTTGVPIVDAGMRELVESHYMHNRSRLITSNYLVKHYFIDWREGEQFYAENLVDYDPSVNNGNWQFSSGSGADAQPYFRMMNPLLQVSKFDPECEYVKTWIPELADVPPEDIIEGV